MVGYKKEEKIGTTTAPMLSVYLKPSGLLKLNLLLLSLASSFFYWKTVGICIYFTVGSNQSKAIAMQVLIILIKMRN